MSWYTLYPLILHDIKCVPACMRSCMSLCVCVCVFAVPRPASCQCVALNPAKAKPNYRRMATDLAGVLTITEEAAGRGSLGKVTAGRELHKSGPQGQGRGGTLFQDLLLSLFIIVQVSARRNNLQLTAHISGNGQKLSEPPPAPSHPSHVGCCLQTFENIKQNKRTTTFLSFWCSKTAITVVLIHYTANVTPSMSRATLKAYHSLQG